jgi:hypothetical protein
MDGIEITLTTFIRRINRMHGQVVQFASRPLGRGLKKASSVMPSDTGNSIPRMVRKVDLLEST